MTVNATEKTSAILRCKELSKIYTLYPKPLDRLLVQLGFKKADKYPSLPALKKVSFSLKKGEILGIVGQNGSGKSTLLQIIAGTLQNSSGEMECNGRVAALLELGAGFHPDYSGEENVYLNAALYGLSRSETDMKYDEIVAFSGLESHVLSQAIHTYSSGMIVRLAFAVAMATEPDLFIIDEALAVGDEAFQRKCLAKLQQMKARGVAILFVSHSPRAVLELCDRAIWLKSGKVVQEGTPKQVMTAYQQSLYQPDEVNHKTHDSELPESAVVYTPQGAVIKQIKLLDEKGEQTKLLSVGKTYTLQYEVVFEKAAEQVRCGMLIKPISGIELAGASSKTQPLEKAESGQRLVVNITFTNRLREGTYFANVGCSAVENGERNFLHRIADALQFTVEATSDKDDSTGLVDISPEYKMEWC